MVLSCNSMNKPSAIITNVTSTAIKVSQRFFILFLHLSYINLLSSDLEINFENENICHNYLQHSYLWYCQSYIISPYWKKPQCIPFCLRAKDGNFCLQVYVHFDSPTKVISTFFASCCSPVKKINSQPILWESRFILLF